MTDKPLRFANDSEARAWLDNALQTGTSRDAALAFFDALPAVAPSEMIGSWRGRGLNTDHPLDGLLELFGWHGKRFESEETVHPLVFDSGSKGTATLDPAYFPLALASRNAAYLKSPSFASILRRLALFLAYTAEPRARLRSVEHRGKITACMVYDHQPILDFFVRVDTDTVLGLMDARGVEPFFFVLEREALGGGMKT